MNNQAIFCVTSKGVELALKINEKFESDIFVLEKFVVHKTISFNSLKEIVRENFLEYRYLVFIMATGIVTRVIAEHIQTKDIDPAIISIDETGTFVIPLLSGHLGGANEKSKDIADFIKAIPVITTATDVSGKIAVDSLAQNLNCKLKDLESAKNITSMILQGKKVEIKLPQNINLDNKNSEGFILVTNKENIEYTQIIPQNICVGIGCKKDTSSENILDFLKELFQQQNLSLKSIKVIASAWVKMNEHGLLESAKILGKQIIFYEKADILEFEDMVEEKSDFVKETIGVYGVSEPCAFLASNRKGKFLIKKAKKNGITISLFEEE